MVLAANGHPNKILTLTVNAAVGHSPAHRRDLLHDAWKRLAKRILRQFALPPEKRWHLAKGSRAASMHRMVAGITGRTKQREVEALHYFAFLEKTKRGEPHLHILLRCPFLPQDWLSEAMADMIGSPIVWIEQINSTGHAIAYVTKYVTKAPAQFGKGKRYWKSRKWEVNQGEPEASEPFDMRGVELRRERWSETCHHHVCNRGAVDQLDDGWFRLWRPHNGRSVERYAWGSRDG